MAKIYSYVLRYDEGGAPNPFWGVCTLTICKPIIRRNVEVGDWVIGTGSKNVKLKDQKIHDYSHKIVYAMRISEILSLEKYDEYCRNKLQRKIPDWYSKDWRLKAGDCIYDFASGSEPVLRKSVHTYENRNTDLNGENSLLSKHFYYFGEDAQELPPHLWELIKSNQGHKKITKPDLIKEFEKWISTFEANKFYAEPQMKWIFEEKNFEKLCLKCSRQKSKEDLNESEEIVE